MPRPYQDPTKDRKLEADTPAPVGYNPAANPIDTYAAPSRTNNALKLADSLSMLNRNLAPLVQQKIDQELDLQKQKGMLAQVQGEAMPTDATQAFRDGYLQLQWDDFGRKAKGELTAEFEKNKHDPNFDYDAFLTEKIRTDLQGIQEDPRAIEAYLRQVLPLKDDFAIAHSKYHQGVVEENTKQFLHNRMGELVAMGGTPEDMRAALDADWPTWQAMGKTKKDMTQAYWDNLLATAEAEKDPTLLAVAFEKDSDGVSLASVVGADKVGDAQRRIEEAQKKQRMQESLPERSLQWVYLGELLKTNPWSPELNVENLLNYVGEEEIFNNDKEMYEFLNKVWDARFAGKEADAFSVYMLSNKDPMIWKSASKRPEFKEFYDKQTAEVWAKVNPNDPQSIIQVTNELIALHELSGVAPRELAGILGGVEFASIDVSKGTVSPDVIFAMQMFKAFQDQGKGALTKAYTTEGGYSLLTLINNRLKNGPITGETVATAIATVRLAENDQALQRNKQLVQALPYRQELDKKVNSEFSPWFSKNAQNMSIIQNAAHQIAERLVVENRLSPEQAMEVALSTVKDSFVLDRHGMAVRVHTDDIPLKDTIITGLNLWQEEYVRKNGEIANYSLWPSEDGKTYQLFDGTSGIPAATITSEQLLAKARPASYGQARQRSDAAALLREVKGKLDRGNYLNGETLAKLEDNPDATAAMLAGDDLNGRQRLLVKQALKARAKARTDETMNLVRGIRELTRRGDILNDSTPLSANIPAKLNPKSITNVAEMAKHRYASNKKAALVMMGEGLVLRAYPDAGGGMAIGFGYNFSKRSEQQAQKDLKAAGVPTRDVADVMAGKKSMTVDQAVKLFELTSKEYEDIARKAYGDGYDKLPENVRAVLFDMAYNTGSPNKFTEVLKLFKEGKYMSASEKLTLKYKDKDGKWRNNERRVQLWREMLSGKFDKYLDLHIKKKGK